MDKKLRTSYHRLKTKKKKHDQNFVVQAIMRTEPRAVALRLDRYLYVSKKQLYKLIELWLQPFIIARMDELRHMDNNIRTVLGSYIKKKPVHLIERSLDKIH